MEHEEDIIQAHEAFKWLFETYPGARVEHEVTSHVPGKFVTVEARAYDKNGNLLATDGRFKYAEHERDDDYYGWAITQALGRAAKKVMALHGVISESHTGEEFTRVLEKKFTELNTIYDTEGEVVARRFADSHLGAVGKRLQAKLNSRISGSVMKPSDKPNGREVVKPSKKKDGVPY